MHATTLILALYILWVVVGGILGYRYIGAVTLALIRPGDRMKLRRRVGRFPPGTIGRVFHIDAPYFYIYIDVGSPSATVMSYKSILAVRRRDLIKIPE